MSKTLYSLLHVFVVFSLTLDGWFPLLTTNKIATAYDSALSFSDTQIQHETSATAPIASSQPFRNDQLMPSRLQSQPSALTNTNFWLAYSLDGHKPLKRHLRGEQMVEQAGSILANPEQFVVSVAAVPGKENTAYYLTVRNFFDTYVWKTINGGTSFQQQAHLSFSYYEFPLDILVNPSNEQEVYVLSAAQTSAPLCPSPAPVSGCISTHPDHDSRNRIFRGDC